MHLSPLIGCPLIFNILKRTTTVNTKRSNEILQIYILSTLWCQIISKCHSVLLFNRDSFHPITSLPRFCVRYVKRMQYLYVATLSFINYFTLNCSAGLYDLFCIQLFGKWTPFIINTMFLCNASLKYIFCIRLFGSVSPIININITMSHADSPILILFLITKRIVHSN